ncbi:MFS transporter [Microbacterium marinilacus]|uniref:MFS transporter n=1 Tax=Microbacterium marinilacus TaxID=415209 RepID=A0ABP7B175_9MICO|nr:MFS transporter [Microbacterium marinilacus]MBY0688685.1 MFS transporter [Microbacterium marinilacus]
MPSPRTPRYLDVLAIPHVPLTFGTALLGRAAYALVILPLLYAVQETSGSIALAGVAIALYGAGASLLAPVRAWLIDRHGATRVLVPLVLAFGGTLTAAGAWSLAGGHEWFLLIAAGLAGVVAPPLGPTMRVAWGSLAPGPSALRKALSLDAVMEELLYLAGPAAAGVALAFLPPGAVLLAPAALVLVGGLGFVCTSAVRAMVPAPDAGDAAFAVPSLLGDRAFVAVLVPALVAGGVSGALSVAVPVVLQGDGGPAAAGIALGLFAGGSAVGGLLFGALRVPGGAVRQLVLLSGALLGTTSLLSLVSGAVTVSVVLAGAGLFFSPVMIVAYVAAQLAGGEHRQNAATTWVNTSHNLGSSAGSALAGVLIQATTVPLTMAAFALCGCALLVLSGVLARAQR